MAPLRRPLARPGLIGWLGSGATFHPPQSVAHCVHVIHEVALHGDLLLEQLVLLHDTGGQQTEGELILIGHD